MIRILYITIFFLFGSLSLFAQADCILLFKYKAAIKSDSIKIVTVGLPTTSFLMGYINQNKEGAFAITKINDGELNQVLTSHLSSDFCGEQDTIINRLFKRPAGGYLIKIFESSADKKQRIREVRIPIDAIKFSSEQIEGRIGIVVDLGEIKV